MTTSHATLGTLLRALLEHLDSAVAQAYNESGLDYKPRYTPVIRALASAGPCRIKDISEGMGVSHSAVSQTVSALARAKWVKLKAGADNRERIVHLTPYAKTKIPLLERHWANTALAAASLDDDIGFPLEDALRRALRALQRQSFADRIRNSARDD